MDSLAVALGELFILFYIFFLYKDLLVPLSLLELYYLSAFNMSIDRLSYLHLRTLIKNSIHFNYKYWHAQCARRQYAVC